MRIRGRTAALLVVPVLVGPLVAVPVSAAPRPSATSSLSSMTLPAGWSLETGPQGTTLRWRTADRVPVAGALLTVKTGATVLGVGVPDADLRGVSVAVDTAGMAALQAHSSALAVFSGTRRLDAGVSSLRTQARRAANSPAPGRAALPITDDVRRWLDAAPLPTNPVDPGGFGRYRTQSGSYTLPSLQVPGMPVPVEIEGYVVAPIGRTTPAPLIVFLHGRHATCYQGGPQGTPDLSWPCAPGWTPIPSLLGYREAQNRLASQGYLTVSIGANGVNAQDAQTPDQGASARSAVVRHHLSQWASWASGPGRAQAPAIARSAPIPAMDSVMLVGHSRGGEGVNRAAVDSTSRDPWRIRGLVHLAPTAFGRNPAPGVPVVALLPACDGDVSDLQGQQYIDAARDAGGRVGADPALRSAVYVLGANHNYFNLEWTPGRAVAPANDDWYWDDSPACGTRSALRLAPRAQRIVGATYIAAAAAVFLRNDAGALPLIDGSAVRAASAGAAITRVHAFGGGSKVVWTPRATTRVVSSNGARGRTCDGYDLTADGTRACAPMTDRGGQPHWLVMDPFSAAPAPIAVDVAWGTPPDPGTGDPGPIDPGPFGRVASPTPTVSIGLDTPVSLRTAPTLSWRIAAMPAYGEQRFALRLIDSRGRSITSPDQTLRSWPGTTYLGRIWATTVRWTPPASARAGLGPVVRMEVIARSDRGQLWILDASSYSSSLPRPRAYALPRVDVGFASVLEGDAPGEGVTRQVAVPITITGRITTPARVFVLALDASTFSPPKEYAVTIPAGARSFVVTLPVTADTRDDIDYQSLVFVKAIEGVVIGDYYGGLITLDDDPTPTVTLTPIADDVVEGDTLTWRLDRSAPSDIPIGFILQAAAPDSGVELDTSDVPLEWLESIGYGWVTEPTAFSTLGFGVFVGLFDRETTSTLTIPTRADGVAEGPEVLRLRSLDAPADITEPIDLLGTVRDAA